MPEKNNVQPVQVKTEEGSLVRELEEEKKSNLKKTLLPVQILIDEGEKSWTRYRLRNIRFDEEIPDENWGRSGKQVSS